MTSQIKHILTSCHKLQLIAHLQSHPEDFKEAVKLALVDQQPYSWRAAWVLWSCMEKNDMRLRRHVKKMIDILPEIKDNQKRELLMILQRMVLDDNSEGRLFDMCTKLWIDTTKAPSLRYNAFRMLRFIAAKHPDLQQELRLLTEPQFLDTLSPGVKHSVSKLIKENQI